MEHPKKFHQRRLKTDTGDLVIEGPLSSEEMNDFTFHEQLTAFRPPKKQFEAVKGIADLPEGRIIVARAGEDIVGYVTFLHPDPLERWSEGNMENLIELGAIEVIPGYRGYRVGSHLIEVAMLDEYMENYIVISTEYYWHWDLKGTGLSIWQYRKVMEKMMGAGGLKPAPTDDPEIISHPANCLMVRIGKNIGKSDIERFDHLRFLTKHQYKQRGFNH